MSGIRPEQLREFYGLLRERGLTTGILAEQLDVSGGAVRRLIGNLRPRRGPIWRALLAQLNATEIKLLMDVEQCPTWNARQRGKQPKMNAAKAALLAGAEVAA